MIEDDDDYSGFRWRVALSMARFPSDSKSKPLAEISIAEEALVALGISWDSLKPIETDPPDVELNIGELKVGIEITELIDEKMLVLRIKRNKNIKLTELENSYFRAHEFVKKADFQMLLTDRIRKKDVILPEYPTYWLLINTAEPSLARVYVEEYLQGFKTAVTHINKIILKLDCEPGYEGNEGGHPVFEIPIERA